MNDKEIKVGQELLEALKKLDVRKELKELTKGQAKLKATLDEVQKKEKSSGLEKARLLELEEEKRESERELSGTLDRLEERLEGLREQLDVVDGRSERIEKDVSKLSGRVDELIGITGRKARVGGLLS